MAYDTKVMLRLIAQNVAKAKTVKEAYKSVKFAANVEGVNLPSFEEMQKEFGEDCEEND